MREELYFLDGATVKARRESQGDTQESLAAATRGIARDWNRKRRPEETARGISVRTINIIEQNHRAVKQEIARMLGEALGVDWKTLIASVVYQRGLSYLPLEGVRKEIRDGVKRAIQLSMYGDPRKAAECIAKLRRDLPALTANENATLIVKEASFRDESGEHLEAYRLLDALRKSADFDALPASTRNWAIYHAAIALRRLNRLDEALSTLEPLLIDKGDATWAAAMHQRGVVFLLKAKNGDASAIVEARNALETSRERWRHERNHREGFSLRRLAEVCVLEGRIAEAALCLFDAGAIFSASGCHRDLAQTREQLRQLF